MDIETITPVTAMEIEIEIRGPSTAGIHDLPAEILKKIFMIYAEQCRQLHFRYDFNLRWRRAPDFVQLITGPQLHALDNLSSTLCSSRCPVILTHVCRFWRDLALDVSHLWSHIVADSNKRRSDALSHVTEFLRRCRAGPIVLTIPPESQINNSISHFDSTHLSRITEINLDLDIVRLENAMALKTIMTQVKQLSSLNIVTDERKDVYYTFLDVQLRRVPQLQRLSLRGLNATRLSNLPNVLPSLTHLCIHWASGIEEHEIYDVLRHTSSLHYLTLIYKGPLPDTYVRRRNPQLQFPQLRILHLEAHATLLHRLLQTISCPTNAAYFLHAYQGIDNIYHEILDDFVGFITAVDPREPPRVLTFTCDYRVRMDIWTCDVKDFCSQYPLIDYEVMRPKYSFDFGYNWHGRQMIQFFPLFSLPSIQLLVVGNPIDDQCPLEVMCESMPSLRFIHIDCNLPLFSIHQASPNLPFFLGKLGHRASDGPKSYATDPSDTPWRVPMLEELLLDKVPLSRGVGQALIDVLAARKKDGLMLNRLVIKSDAHELRKDEVEALRDVVGDLQITDPPEESALV